MGWHGWELGMEGDKVAAIQSKLIAKYQWVRDEYPELQVTGVYDEATRDAVLEFQYRVGYPVTGVADWATQVRLGVIEEEPKPAHVGTFYTVHGTGVGMWDGPPADTARQVAGVWRHQPIGNYPASAFPMKPSVDAGREELVVQVSSRPKDQPHVLGGYSQGAMVIVETYLNDYLPVGGRLHDWLPSLKAAVTWGNPMREKGVAHGNVFSGLPVPEGRGIADMRLEDTPLWWKDFAHGANSVFGRDLYTDVPDDDVGEMCTAIYRAVQQGRNVFLGRDSLLEQIVEMTQRPITEVYAAFRAIVYGGQFFLSKPWATYAHTSYGVGGAVRYLSEVAENEKG